MPNSPAPDTAAPPAPPLLRRVQYEDFKLLVEGSGGEYRACVVESPAGESSSPQTTYWSFPTGAQRLKESDLRRMGASLFDAFISNEIRELFRESIIVTKQRHDGGGLRLKLLIEPMELSREPWELLYDSRSGSYLGLSSQTPIVRHGMIPQPVEQLIVQPPLRILGVIASPNDPNFPALDVQKERALIDAAVADARAAGLVELQWLDAGTWQAIQEAMRQPWHVFHFCGHGDFNADSGEGFVVLENARGVGGAHQLAARDLGLLLRGEGNIRLAVLNCCKGAVGDTSTSSTSVAGALMRAGMGGVVAMQNPISDAAALTFAQVTYLAIASGLPLDAALGSARVAMKIERAAPVEWWTPVLHMRSTDGVLFDLPSPRVTSPTKVRGMQYLGPDLDQRLERALARRRWHERLLYAWMLVLIPLLGFLIATPMSSDVVSAEIEASGLTFTLASERELFSELPRLQSFTASGFRQVSLPGSAFPVTPGTTEKPVVSASAVDNGSWISLQPWTLPAGTTVTWDHPRGAAAGEYVLSLAVGAGQRFHAGLVNRIRLSRFGSPAELHDYADSSALELFTADTSLDLVVRFLHPAGVGMPRLSVDSLQLSRQVIDDAGPHAEPTVLAARVHFDGRDMVDSTALRLSGLHDAGMNSVRLMDRGIAFTIRGSVRRIVIGGIPLAFPSRLRWLIREQPAYLALGGLAYLLILVMLVMMWRTSHVASTKPI